MKTRDELLHVLWCTVYCLPDMRIETDWLLRDYEAG